MLHIVETVARFILDVMWIFFYMFEALIVKLLPIKYRTKDISGQIALVTGSGGGIGRLICLGLAQQGCKIVCWDVAKLANEETARLLRMCKYEVHTYQVDLTSRQSIYDAAERVKREVGTVSILINNAGVVTGKHLLECTDEQIIRTFDVNVLAHFWTVKSFLPAMIAQGKGHIVTIASLAGMNGMNRLVDYCASKFAAVGFDESLRAELLVDGHTGIETTVVCPYFVRTPLFDGIKSKFVPVLEAEDVAKKTINAILTNQKVCIIPGLFTLMNTLKSFMPYKASVVAFEAFGMGETMNAFTGPKTKYL